MKEHIARIEAQLKELDKCTKSFSSNEDVSELLRIIHQNGWTTPAEAQLVLTLTEATIANIQQAAHTRRELLKCAKLVGTSAAVGVN